MNIPRRKTKIINIGGIRIGGNNPIVIQSMVKVKTSNIKSVLSQIHNLESVGCDIIRLAIKDNFDAAAVKPIKKETNTPLVADIHFDWRLALEAIDNGVDKIRLNPGNINKREQVREIARAAKLNRIPVRVGLNSGSLPSGAVEKKGGIAAGMCRAALDYVRILEREGVKDIIISLKASNIFDTIEAYRRLGEMCDYPFHLGLTATGAPFEGIVKSSIAIGSLLLDGIGDTIRVSLTDRPEKEVITAKSILKALDLRRFGPEIISCPTCGRCEVDLIKIVKDLEKRLSNTNYQLLTPPLKVAVMGCVVNGPGEARDADIGIAFGNNQGLLFKKGKPVKKVSLSECVSLLVNEMKHLTKEDKFQG